MAAPFTVSPVLGVDLNTITLAADVGSTSGAEDAPQLGTQVFGSDGRRYIYAQAAAAITASTAQRPAPLALLLWQWLRVIAAGSLSHRSKE